MQAFGLAFEFDRSALQEKLDSCIRNGGKGYVCALDGNNIATALRDEKYREILNSALVNNADSTWATSMINSLHGTHHSHYCSSDLFVDILDKRCYKQYFLGSSPRVLDALKNNLAKYDAAISGMPFVDLPYCALDEFDYEGIAKGINEAAPDVIWVSLGAPKQEMFMSRLLPYLDRGVMFGVGAIFNFFSGLDDVPRRAPKWMIRLHLEFLYRLMSEPRKQFKRCLKIIQTLPVAYIKEKRHR